ncbi:MAG: hypothetical protein AB7V48_02620 [Sedimentibacter sp.]
MNRQNIKKKAVIIEGRTLAKSWWGKAWNLNLESYADYENNLTNMKRLEYKNIGLLIPTANI